MTVPEAAERLGVTEATLRRWIRVSAYEGGIIQRAGLPIIHVDIVNRREVVTLL